MRLNSSTTSFTKLYTNNFKNKTPKPKSPQTTFHPVSVFYGNTKIYDNWEFEFVNCSAVTEFDSKIEDRLKKLEWRFDFGNVISLIVLSLILLILLYTSFYNWYVSTFWFLVNSESKYPVLIDFALSFSFLESNFSFPASMTKGNHWLLQTFLTLCSRFSLIF